MKTLKRKFLAFSITIIFLFSTGVYIFAYPNRFHNFNGNGHGAGCHGGNFVLGSGSISYTLSSGTTVNTNEIFVISLQINGFTQAASATPELGFPSGRSDNAEFTNYNVTQISATTDSSGNSGVHFYELTAPGTPSSYTLTADAMYTDGSTGSYFITTSIVITVQSPPPTDTSPPKVIITSPLDNNYVSGDILISATADDQGGSGVHTVWAEIANASYSESVSMSGTEPNYSGIWDSTVVFDGVYTLTVNANDSASPSNLNNTESVIVIVDNTAPYLTIVSVLPDPSNGITTITATNTSSDIDLNGIRANITTPSFQSIHIGLIYQGGDIWNGTFTVMENGIYSVNINATDNTGNIGYAGPVDITGDITAPQLNIESPANDGDQIGGSTISLSGNAFSTGSSILSIYINDSRWGISNQPQTDPSGSASGSFIFNNNTNIPIGFYWVAINITDQAGNVNVSYRYFEVVSSDINPPILIITSINPNPSNGFTNITVISSEPLKATPLLNITLPNSSIISRTMFLISPLTWRANYTVISDGLHTININGTDNSDNTGYVSANFNGDVSPPIISIDTVLPNPSNSIVVITASNSSADINENRIWATLTTPSFQSIFVKLDYQGSNLWNGTFTITENGDYTVNLNATDYAGNTGYAGPVVITGDLIAPSIAIVSVLPNPSSGLVGITATNSSSDINGNGIWATVTTPSSQNIHIVLIYQGSNIWNGTFTVLENDLYVITINATDIAQNTGYDGPINISGDVSAPIIDIDSPRQDSLIGNNAPAFNLTIIEPNLHSTWYRLYNGTSLSGNVNFTGTIGIIDTFLWNLMPEGIIIIVFYANDTFGKIGTTQVNITKDTIDPIIIINSPVENQEFITAPAFDIDIVEIHFQSAWYSLFDGIFWSNNLSLSGSTGTVDTSLWKSMPNGNITIRFYATDILGNIGFSDLTVRKNLSTQNDDNQIPLFDLMIVVGTFGAIVGIMIIIVWRSRARRFIQ